MKKLNKNFRGQNKTVEAMSGTCINGCDCAAGDCACRDQSDHSYDTWDNQWTNYRNGFKIADF